MSTNEQYTVENGIIQDPGKFQGEAEYIPYFWGMNEFAISLDFVNGATVYCIQIQETDVGVSSELASLVGQWVCMQETDDGFVYGTVKPQAEYDLLVATHDKEWIDYQEHEARSEQD